MEKRVLIASKLCMVTYVIKTLLFYRKHFCYVAVISQGTSQWRRREDATFVYCITLADNTNVLQNIRIAITNQVSGANSSIIVVQGNDIYKVIFPNVSTALDQAEFLLQLNQSTITRAAHAYSCSVLVSITHLRCRQLIACKWPFTLWYLIDCNFPLFVCLVSCF